MNTQLNQFLFRNINEVMIFTVKSDNPKNPDHYRYQPDVNRISTDNDNVVITNKGRRSDKILHIMKWDDIIEIASVCKK